MTPEPAEENVLSITGEQPVSSGHVVVKTNSWFIITKDSMGKKELAFLITVSSVVLIILLGILRFKHPAKVKIMTANMKTSSL